MRLKALLLSLLLGVSTGAAAFGDLVDNSNKAAAGAAAKAKAAAGALAVSVPIMVLKSAPNATIEGDQAPKIPEPAAIAPNPNAPPPSAQCRFANSVTGAVPQFGIGITASEWDRICGLWLAAQQTTGDAQTEAAAAAFCLTMKDAGVYSATCFDWEEGQNALMMSKPVLMNDNQATVVFGGSGSGGWN